MKQAALQFFAITVLLMNVVSCNRGAISSETETTLDQIRVVTLESNESDPQSVDLFKSTHTTGRLVWLEKGKAEYFSLATQEASIFAYKGDGMIVLPENRGIPFKANEIVYMPAHSEFGLRATSDRSAFLVILAK